MINILVSVRRPFSGQILSMEKGWELRKNAPRIPRGEHVTLWLYESGMDGERAIIGKCRMVSYVRMRHMPFRCRPDDFIEDFCVTGEHLRAYLPCFAWGLQDPVRLPAAVPLSAIGLTRPPQSWQYLTDEQAAILKQTTKTCEHSMKTCEECLYWDGFDGCCISTKSGKWFKEIPADTPACEAFRPEEVFPPDEEIEQEEEDDA